MKKIVVFIAFLFFHVILFAQTGTVRGIIYDENLEPTMGATVIVQNSNFYAISDLNGVFIIPSIPFGNYVLEVSYIGYAKQNINFKIDTKNTDLLKVFLQESSMQLDDVKINVDRQERKNDVSVSVVKLTTKTINKLPSIGGEPDVAQFLQILPGVVFTGDQGGQLYIRGGAPIHNKVLLDGMTIYSPFHSIGFFSVFDTDLIKKADVYTGGFGAEYGGRISSIMDIQTRDGNKKKISSKLSANTFASKLLLEGPMWKYKKDRMSNSFIFSGKTSYLNQTSKALYSYIDSAGVGLPYSFSDFYGKLSFFSPNGSKVNIYGFGFNDYVHYVDLTEMGWLTYGFGTNILLVPTSAKMLVEGKMSYSKYSVFQENVGALTKNMSDIGGYNIGLHFSYFISQENKLKYGVDVLGYSTLLEFSNSIGTLINPSDNYDVFGAYVDYKYNNRRLILNPGIRIQSYTSMGEFSIEPRLGLKYNLNEKLRLKASCGLFSQNLLSTSSQRNVVNLFSGFLSTPTSLPDSFENNVIDSYLQKAKHYIAGIEYDVNDYLDINIEGYIKDFSQLIAENKNRTFDDKIEFQDEPDYLKKAFIVERGLASGCDILLKYVNDRINVWSVYSFSIIERTDEIQTYYPHYDRRHNFNFLLSYLFGKNKGFEFSIRWNYGSGFPFMQTQGYYEALNVNDMHTNIYDANGDLGIIYAGLGSGRLPDYHRLDISLKKTHHFTQHIKLEGSIGVTNLYNRDNIFYYNRVRAERVNQLPILPSVGLKFIF